MRRTSTERSCTRGMNLWIAPANGDRLIWQDTRCGFVHLTIGTRE